MQQVDLARDPAAIEKAKRQVVELKQMMKDSAPARAERQKAKPLYERLGGQAPIRAVVTDIIELHFTDPVTASLCVGVDKQKLIDHVVNWLCQAAGGNEKYGGRDMVTAHAHLAMTPVHFVTAGGHIMQTLQKYGVPEPEIQEVMCAIIAHYDDVIR